MRQHYITLRGLRGVLLDVLAEGPPTYPGERWFHADLHRLSRDELAAERQRLHLRLLLTPPVDQDRWPATWLADRLDRVEALLRADRAAAAWARARR